MDPRPRPCWNVLSALAPLAGFACALLAALIRNGHSMSALKAGVTTLGVFLFVGFVFACIAIVRSERMWGITAIGMALNAPFILVAVAAPWDWPF